jgi:hypothetical protein
VSQTVLLQAEMLFPLEHCRYDGAQHRAQCDGSTPSVPSILAHFV